MENNLSPKFDCFSSYNKKILYNKKCMKNELSFSTNACNNKKNYYRSKTNFGIVVFMILINPLG
jgi:hypothetical protein